LSPFGPALSPRAARAETDVRRSEEDVMSKLVVLYPKPADAGHFETHYRETHAPLAAKMPGLKSYMFGPADSLDGSQAAYHWMFVGKFESKQAILDALGSPEGQAAVADIPNYSPDAPTIFVVEETTG
jgi:uncharacterized protein (TIGR02118 family)